MPMKTITAIGLNSFRTDVDFCRNLSHSIEIILRQKSWTGNEKQRTVYFPLSFSIPSLIILATVLEHKLLKCVIIINLLSVRFIFNARFCTYFYCQECMNCHLPVVWQIVSGRWLIDYLSCFEIDWFIEMILKYALYISLLVNTCMPLPWVKTCIATDVFMCALDFL